jgi:hypothetical protein
MPNLLPYRDDERAIGTEIWYSELIDLGGIIGAAQGQGGRCVRARKKVLSLKDGHGATLQAEALQRRRRQGGEVTGIGKAQIALGGYMHSDRVKDGNGKMAFEEGGGAFLMTRVKAVLGSVFAVAMQQMAEIVKQCGGDECLVRVAVRGLTLHEPGGLQGMVQDRYGLAEIGGAAAALQNLEKLVDGCDWG